MKKQAIPEVGIRIGCDCKTVQMKVRGINPGPFILIWCKIIAETAYISGRNGFPGFKDVEDNVRYGQKPNDSPS